MFELSVDQEHFRTGEVTLVVEASGAMRVVQHADRYGDPS